MRFEIKRDGDAVEIHLTNEDGSVTVWLCDNQETALYKLAAILFVRPEGEKRAKRSILVGTFREEKAPERKPSLSERARVIRETFEKAGMKDAQEAAPAPDMEQLLELLKGQKSASPNMQFTQPNYPYVQPFVQPIGYPYSGQIIGAGSTGGGQLGDISINLSDDGALFSGTIPVNLVEVESMKTTIGGMAVTTFKCSSNTGHFE
jgi:hypothetical protein